MKKRTVLAIGAHPDDIEIGCGGTIRKHVERGDEVYYSIATGGEKGGQKNIRIKEAEKAAEKMGVTDVYFMSLRDTFIAHDGHTIGILDKILQERKPSVVYVHSLKDYHQDHMNIARSILSASRKMKNSIFCYEAPSTTLEFKPTAFSDISITFEMKMECIQVFASQEKKDYVEREAIVNLSKFRGKTINVEYAEAFEVLRLIEW
ncbi:PIG-L deacetylase family protein [Methanolobus sp. ZRKC2]|uniref:PIG-L deacetylase family protein n=1 Tax=Methanolobus sp. ZRKC2 TaxID=3125783 RepID=UPI003251A715